RSRSCHEAPARPRGRTRDGARLLQRLDLVRWVAERLQHLVRVFAERWTGTLRPARRPIQLDGHPELPDGSIGAGLIELDDHLARADQVRVERLVEIEDRLEAAVVL